MKSKNRNHELPPLKPGNMLDDDEPFAAAPEPPPPRDVWHCNACGWGHADAGPQRCVKCGGPMEELPSAEANMEHALALHEAILAELKEQKEKKKCR